MIYIYSEFYIQDHTYTCTPIHTTTTARARYHQIHSIVNLTELFAVDRYAEILVKFKFSSTTRENAITLKRSHRRVNQN